MIATRGLMIVISWAEQCNGLLGAVGVQKAAGQRVPGWLDMGFDLAHDGGADAVYPLFLQRNVC